MNETEQFLNSYFESTLKLSKCLDTSIGDLDDFREEPWNGDVDNPCWGEYSRDSCDGMLEFTYGEEGRYHVKKDGLCFVWCYFSTGDKGWVVFRESNIVKEDDDDEEKTVA